MEFIISCARTNSLPLIACLVFVKTDHWEMQELTYPYLFQSMNSERNVLNIPVPKLGIPYQLLRTANNVDLFKIAVKIISFHYIQSCMVGDRIDKKF